MQLMHDIETNPGPAHTRASAGNCAPGEKTLRDIITVAIQAALDAFRRPEDTKPRSNPYSVFNAPTVAPTSQRHTEERGLTPKEDRRATSHPRLAQRHPKPRHPSRRRTAAPDAGGEVDTTKHRTAGRLRRNTGRAAHNSPQTEANEPLAPAATRSAPSLPGERGAFACPTPALAWLRTAEPLQKARARDPDAPHATHVAVARQVGMH